MNFHKFITDDLFSDFLKYDDDMFVFIKGSSLANELYAFFISENSQALKTVEEVKLKENQIIHASTDKSVVAVVQCLPLLDGRPAETTKQALIEKIQDSYKLHCRLRESIEKSKEFFILFRRYGFETT